MRPPSQQKPSRREERNSRNKTRPRRQLPAVHPLSPDSDTKQPFRTDGWQLLYMAGRLRTSSRTRNRGVSCLKPGGSLARRAVPFFRFLRLRFLTFLGPHRTRTDGADSITVLKGQTRFRKRPQYMGDTTTAPAVNHMVFRGPTMRSRGSGGHATASGTLKPTIGQRRG